MAHDGPLPGDVLAAESTFAEALRWVSGEAQVTKWCRFVGDAMRESVAGTLTLYKLLSLTSQADRSDEERTRIWQDVIMSADHVVRAFDAAAGEHEVPAVVGQQLRQGLCAVIAMSGAAQASHAADEQVCRCPLPPTAGYMAHATRHAQTAALPHDVRRILYEDRGALGVPCNELSE